MAKHLMTAVRSLAPLLALIGLLSAAEQAGPFQVARSLFNPGSPAPVAIGRDGAVESVQIIPDGARTGRLRLEAWNGDNQAGGRSVGGLTLALPPGRDAAIGLTLDWSLTQGLQAGGDWLYGTRFQQDALLMVGYADADPSALGLYDGSGKGLDGALPYDRIMLVLPWRWVTGGGSKYQTSNYKGNPPEAGVWAVPAGTSLAEAQAAPGTWQLAGLDAVLANVKPHEHAMTGSIRVLGDGHWQVALDINDDGTVDLATDDQQSGNRPAPFPGMTPRSGLLVGLRPAMGTRAGMVGRTACEVRYRLDTGPLAIPVDRRPVTASIPTLSKTSPVTIEGYAWDATRQVQITAPTLAQPLAPTRIGSRLFLADVPLSADAPTLIQVSQAGSPTPSVVSASTTWVPVDLYHDERLTIRRGDSILLTWNGDCGPGTPVDIDTDGDGTIDRTIGGGDHVIAAFPSAGIFTATAWRDGRQVGSAIITVADLIFPKAIACEVGFERGVTVQLGTTDPASVVFAAQDAKDLSVRVLSTGTGIVRLGVKPLRRGTPVILAKSRATGQILANAVIDELTFTDSMAAGLVTLNGSGTGVITLRPYIPNLWLHLDVMAGTAAFADGAKTIRVNTSVLGQGGFTTLPDPLTGETIGRFEVVMAVPPKETAFCHKAYFTQENSPIESITIEKVGNGKEGTVTVGGGVFVVQEGQDESPSNVSGTGKYPRPQDVKTWMTKSRPFGVAESGDYGSYSLALGLNMDGGLVDGRDSPTNVSPGSGPDQSPPATSDDISTLQDMFALFEESSTTVWPQSGSDKIEDKTGRDMRLHTGFQPSWLSMTLNDDTNGTATETEYEMFKIYVIDMHGNGKEGSKDEPILNEMPIFPLARNPTDREITYEGQAICITAKGPSGSVPIRIHSRNPDKIALSEQSSITLAAGATASITSEVITKNISPGEPIVIYGYGLTQSASIGDAVLQVDAKEERTEYQGGDVSEVYDESQLWVIADTEKVTVVKMQVNEIDWGATDDAQFHIIKQDKDGTPYQAPHWFDKDDDGSADAVSEHKFPLLFTSGATPRVKRIQVKTWPKLPEGLSPRLRGIDWSNDNLDMPPSDGAINQSGIVAENIDAEDSLTEKTVRFRNTFDEEWSVSLDDETTWAPVGVTKNRLYAALSKPSEDAEKFESVVHWACANSDGQTNETGIVKTMWSYFEPLDAKRKPQDGYNSNDSGKLQYYHYQNEWPNFSDRGFRLSDLLTDGKGRCQAWMEYHYAMLSVHGIKSQMSTIQPLSVEGFSDEQLGIVIKNWDLEKWVPKTPIPGQNIVTPAQWFNNHAVIRYGEKIYDPSYGKVYDNLLQWEDAALEAVSAQISAYEVKPYPHKQGVQQCSIK